MQVKWLRTALRNLDAEAAFIAEDDPAAARGGGLPLVRRRNIAPVSGADSSSTFPTLA